MIPICLAISSAVADVSPVTIFTSMPALIHCLYDEDPGIQLHELSLFFTTFVMLQFWNLLNAKTLGSRHSCLHRLWADRGMLIIMVAILLGQWLIVTFGGQMFRTTPLSLTEWTVIIVATSAVVWIKELYRLCKR